MKHKKKAGFRACLCMMVLMAMLSFFTDVMEYGAAETSHTVVYNANGGSGAPSAQTKAYGTVLTLSSTTPTRSGYNFIGWSTSADGAGTMYGAGDLYGHDQSGGVVTLYAVWTVESYSHTVIYNANGGTGAPASQLKTYGSVLTLSSVMPVRTGYTFKCWNTAADSTGTAYNAGDLYGTDKNGGTVTLYAIWEMDAYSHTVVYNANGGTGAPASQIKEYGSILQLTERTPTRNGYNFHCWNTAADSSGTAYNPGSFYGYDQNGGTVTLYAIWQPWTHQVVYHANGGTGAPSAQTKTYGTTINLHGIIPVRTGYTFTGWNTSLDGTGTAYSPGQTYGYDQNGKTVTLYAMWRQNEYKVTYHANGGTTSAAEAAYHYGDAVNLTPSASKSGYRFVGWAASPADSKPLTSLKMPDLATSPNTDYSSDWELTLYALYTIDVSDVANHDYPSYSKVRGDEVYLMVWKNSSPSTYMTYPFSYTGDAGIMFYNYKLGSTDVSSYVGSEAYGWQIVIHDNAGNYSILYKDTSGGTPVPEPNIPKEYVQTVNHYRYDTASGKWIYFDTDSTLVKEGQTFTPQYVTPPTGFKRDHIDGAYVVSSARTVNAYYSPYAYTLTFHPNGGSVSPTSKSIYYGDYYGELPTPSRTGYTFTGWYTAATGGSRVTSSTKYVTTGNTTIYAHWTINSYNVMYDYWTNGGTSADKASASVQYNGTVDLSVKAVKNGWTFVGWNTNPDAETGLSSLRMGDKEVVLYAIYRKDITATFIDGNNGTTRSTTITIYNRETSCIMPMPNMNAISGWKSLGWSLGTEADAVVTVSPGASYELSDSTVFYGCYMQEITVSYDTNGSAQTVQPQTKERHFNASGSYKNPVFTIAGAPSLPQHSFVRWEESGSNGNVYEAGAAVQIDHSMTLAAKWDKFPELEAYDRYFTLEDAQDGKITQDVLLEKVTAADKEDGILENGRDVTIPDYSADKFTGLTTDKTIIITIRAEDSFGNTVDKQISVHIVDATVSISPKITYVRFISQEFFTNGTEAVTPEEGGLEDTSIWRTNTAYNRALENALENEKTSQIYSKIETFGLNTEVKVAGSGEWEHADETWTFSPEQIEEVKSFVDAHGYGNIVEKNALEQFFELFDACREEK